MHGKRPGDVRHVGAFFEEPDLDAAEGQFARKHQAGRPCPYNYYVGSLHEAGW
jgi:hypothetical protein